jgi:yeast amino acid transporter
MSIPIVAYGFLGVEIVAVTAFEARNRESLRSPSRLIAWVMSFTYLFCFIPGAIAVSWQHRDLPRLDKPPSDQLQGRQAPEHQTGCQDYYPLIVIAAFEYGSRAAGWYFNACIVYFCISAANTALYVSSRTLYGLVRQDTEPPDLGKEWYRWPSHIIQLLGRVSPRRNVPIWALLVSGLAFCWLPGLRKGADVSSSEVH